MTIRRAGPKLGRNDPCSCKSGKKFKNCCLLAMKPRKPPPSVEDIAAIQSARQAPHAKVFFDNRVKEFRERFGREPGPSDRIFFGSPSQQQIIEQISEAMIKSRIDPSFVYAFQKTGLIVVSENMDFLTGRDIMTWLDAVEEYSVSQELIGAQNE